MKKEFVENFLFERYKDYAFSNSDEFKAILSKYDIDFTKLYSRIIKYQVKKYSISLCGKYRWKYKNRHDYINERKLL